MNARLFWVVVATIVVASPCTSAQSTSKPRIEELTASLADGGVRVSFRVANALDEEGMERVHSGMPLEFRHKIDVLARRSVPIWPGRVVARATVVTQVAYDSLTRQYTLDRRLSLKPRGKKDGPATREEQRITESTDEMRRWMTELRDVLVHDPTRPLPDDRLRVDVHSSVGRHYILWVFPATVTASAQQRLER